ncbi:MAG: DUF1592 domain-containing protein [Nannocystaceae bacterium]|nr:DUF1592 domain-containing protein [Nannocystaceae bacterium]
MKRDVIFRVLATLLVAQFGAGCYSGLGDANGPAAADGGDDDGADDDGVDDDAGDDDGGDDDGVADASVSVSGLGRLTRLEYERSVTAIFGESLVVDVNFENLPADGVIGRFESNAGLNVNIDIVDGYRLVAEDVGEAAGALAASLLGCEASAACVESFIRERGLLIYRRPLTDAEADVFIQFWNTMAEEGGLSDAMRLTVSAMLQTPDFLYRLERGEDGAEGDVRRLTGYEVASRMSYFLWSSGPDLQLLDAAAAGELDTSEGIEAQTERLLADSQADETILRFHNSWLGIDELDTHLVDNEEFPEFEALREDMKAETQAFVLHVFREDDARVSTLFGANYSFASPELAALYGDGVVSAEDGKIELDPSQRLGILTQASYLTTHARTPERAPIYRGTSLLIDVFCQFLPPPPDVGTAVSFDSTASARDQIDEATSGPACRGCHSTINPIGFLFENYDAVGRWRTMDGVFPVEAAASVLGTDIDGDYANAAEMIPLLAESEQVRRCVSRQWLRFALSRPDGPEDFESIAAAADQAQGDMRALVGAITQTDTFRYRRLAD